MDRMTEREKLRTFGTYLIGMKRDYQQGIDTYENLVSRYPADSAGYNNLAVAYFSTLDFTKALENGKKAIGIYPKSFKYRANYALYAMYATDFETAGDTARELIKEDPTFETAYLPLAMEAIAAGNLDAARGYYETAAKAGPAGASLAAIGIGDLDIYEGRYPEAIARLPGAIQADKDQGNDLAAVAKFVALADAYNAVGRKNGAQTALTEARQLSTEDNVVLPIARRAVEAGQYAEARAIANDLSKRVPRQSRAYGQVIEAEIRLREKEYPAAIDALNAARKLADAWLVRYLLGLTYFQMGNYVAARQDFEECQKRRGEATALFLDDLPTVRYYATVPYWLGRAREASSLDPRTQHREFLAIRGGAADDPLVKDAQRRLAALAK
jgi:tetratricopeptide (TPR) repeat protein